MRVTRQTPLLGSILRADVPNVILTIQIIIVGLAIFALIF